MKRKMIAYPLYFKETFIKSLNVTPNLAMKGHLP